MPWVLTQGDNWVLYIPGEARIFILFWKLMQLKKNLLPQDNYIQYTQGSKEACKQSQYFPLWMFVSN